MQRFKWIEPYPALILFVVAINNSHGVYRSRQGFIDGPTIGSAILAIQETVNFYFCIYHVTPDLT